MAERATKLCDKYARIKGAGTIARPERHPFFQKLAPLVKLHLEKSMRENGFMYAKWGFVSIFLIRVSLFLQLLSEGA